MTTDTMRGRRVLITGATDGIGRHTATALARLGADVTIVGRDERRGEDAARAIAGDAGNPAVRFRAADLSAQADVRRLAHDVTAAGDPLDVLVNNVGGLYTRRWETIDGIEASLAVNALNPLLLTRLLWPALSGAPAARVVHVTGGMPGRIDTGDLQNTRGYLGIRAYSHAKTVMMALAREQASRTRDSGVTVNVCYPGAADTPMTRAMTPATVPWAMRVIWPLFRPVMRRATAQRAARSSVHLATAAGLHGVTGVYVNSNGKPVAWPGSVRDDAVRWDVWNAAEQLTGLADGSLRRLP